ncbi:MAG: acyl carrier protein [Phycisphaerae bacterium]
MLDTIRQCMSRAMKLDAQTASSITESTTAADVPRWTSVAHLSLVLELERTFKTTFDNNEIVSMGSVAAIMERLKAKGIAGG